MDGPSVSELMSGPTHYFTVSAGRSGQASLAALLSAHCSDAFVAFEEPQVNPVLPGPLGDVERHFRRRFIETDELLGRGRVLGAFERGDCASLKHYGTQRLRWIERRMKMLRASVYIDISKHFAHGLHVVLCREVRSFGLIRLVRDPLDNMRSYLNRSKNFAKDNNSPAAVCNELVMPEPLSDAERYLWAWTEAYLRFDAIVEKFKPAVARTIRTEELSDSECVSAHLKALKLSTGPVAPVPPQNTNQALGLPETHATDEDIRTFENFVAKLPASVRARIDYLDGYDPQARTANV